MGWMDPSVWGPRAKDFDPSQWGSNIEEINDTFRLHQARGNYITIRDGVLEVADTAESSQGCVNS